MNCAHCGKKNSEDRLFCGFCGMPLATPEKKPAGDDLERAMFGRPKDEPRRAPEPVADVPDERAIGRPKRPEPVADVPDERPTGKPKRPEPIADVPEDRPADKPFRTAPFRPVPGAAPRRPAKADEPADPLAKPLLNEPVELRAKHPPVLQRSSAPVKPRNPNTIVPPRETDPNDIFMDGAEAEDDFDFDDGAYPRLPRPGFFARHARGLVSFTLLLLTLLIVGYWLFFGAGQRVLGQLYLSGNPATYLALGDEAEEGGAHEAAGAYYLKALELTPGDRNYAIKAANAYIVAGNSGKATAALEKLIAIDPDAVEPYFTLKSLYPDPAARPLKVSQLLQQGYQRTGDQRLRDS